MKKVIFLIVFLVGFINSFAQLKGKVIKVKDGDTIVILDDNYTQYTIRVADIDCPEKRQPFGKKAKQFVSNEIFGKIVKIKVKGKDRYGRTIGYVIYGKKDLSEELLKNGLAWNYRRYSDKEHYQELEDIARKNKVGLFIDPNPIYPPDYRHNR